MSRTIKAILLLVVAGQAVGAIVLAFGFPTAMALLPFEGATPMSYILLASFLAAAAVSTGWAVLAERPRALSGIALDYLAIFVSTTAFAVLRAVGGGGQDLGWMVVPGFATAAFGLWLFAWSRRFAWRDSRPMPRVVRASFVVFVVALVAVASLLIAGVPDVLPWPITPDLSVLFGLEFLGAAAYFAYGLAIPVWENAVGQLAGFLAYDLVLIVPFLTRLPGIADKFRISLILYLIVVVYSGLLAGYYLLVARRYRVRDGIPAPSAG
jgi:hypothetical protein